MNSARATDPDIEELCVRGERRGAKLLAGAAVVFLVVATTGCRGSDTTAGAVTAASVVAATNDETLPTAPPLTAQLPIDGILPGILARVGVPVAALPPEASPPCQGFTLTAALFDDNSAALRAGSGDDLTILAQRLKAGPGPVTVIGYTDARPTAFPGGNQGLSEARAHSVRDALANRGVDDIVDVEGRGDREPVDLGTTEAADRRNRRVEVTVNCRTP